MVDAVLEERLTQHALASRPEPLERPARPVIAERDPRLDPVQPEQAEREVEQQPLGLVVRPRAPVLLPQPGSDLRRAHRLIEMAEADDADRAVTDHVRDDVDVLAVLHPKLAALREEVARVFGTHGSRERQEPRDIGVRRVLEQRHRIVLARLSEHHTTPHQDWQRVLHDTVGEPTGGVPQTRCMQMSLGEADFRVKAGQAPAGAACLAEAAWQRRREAAVSGR